eukprot:2349698-Prymnesium_polylepis.1
MLHSLHPLQPLVCRLRAQVSARVTGVTHEASRATCVTDATPATDGAGATGILEKLRRRFSRYGRDSGAGRAACGGARSGATRRRLVRRGLHSQ